MSTSEAKPVVLTIAGLDPSGGAGIVADIKTISALGCFPAAALTSITFQNTTGVFGAEHQTAATLRAQVEPIVQDLSVAAAKTGMLPTAEIVAEVARLFSEGNLPAPVVDPVVVATSGDVLIDEEAFQILKSQLFPLARIVTPNIPEAEKLAGFAIETEARHATRGGSYSINGRACSARKGRAQTGSEQVRRLMSCLVRTRSSRSFGASISMLVKYTALDALCPLRSLHVLEED